MRRLLLVVSVTLLSCFVHFGAIAKSQDQNQDQPSSLKQAQFIESMVKKHKFDQEKLSQLFAQVNINGDVLKRIKTPYEAQPWYQYKKHFLGSKRIKAGQKFIDQHLPALQRAEQKFGVPKEMITAILGVETFYGEYKGKIGVLEALSTLAFAYPPRAKFFKKELEDYLLLTREQHFDPLALKGSYAGAMGTPQFIPSSYRRYAVDFDNRGQANLLNHINDAIGSVANYFKQHGWLKNGEIVYPIDTVKPEIFAKVNPKNNPKPNKTLAQLNKLGVEANTGEPQKHLNTKFSVIEFDQNKAHKAHYLGLQNFYVITRYNHSNNYAMAVYLLSEALKTDKG